MADFVLVREVVFSYIIHSHYHNKIYFEEVAAN